MKITVALLNFVITEQNAEDKIFFRRVLVERLVADMLDNFNTFLCAEKNVDFFRRDLSCQKVDAGKPQTRLRLKSEFSG